MTSVSYYYQKPFRSGNKSALFQSESILKKKQGKFIVQNINSRRCERLPITVISKMK